MISADRLARDERGSSLVEFVFALPMRRTRSPAAPLNTNVSLSVDDSKLQPEVWAPYVSSRGRSPSSQVTCTSGC